MSNSQQNAVPQDTGLEGGAEHYRSIATILDSLDALVYVADMNTHEVLFLNRYGKEVWGDFKDKPCWKLLQSEQTGPCRFCSNPKLLDARGEPTGVWVWEMRNTVNGRWYECRDQAIRWWDGRLVRLEIATDITERKRLEQELQAALGRAREMASTDELTGLNNRRAFFELGEQSFRQARRSGRSMAVIMLDIDHFKRINDTHGHQVGDRVLQALADTLRPLLREADILGRLGGEEFAVILSDTGLGPATAIAERLRRVIEAMAVEQEPEPIRFTASFGVAAGSAADLNLDRLLGEADQALYKAKRAGRNRVEAVLPSPDA